jgi:hypothetical protein
MKINSSRKRVQCITYPVVPLISRHSCVDATHGLADFICPALATLYHPYKHSAAPFTGRHIYAASSPHLRRPGLSLSLKGGVWAYYHGESAAGFFVMLASDLLPHVITDFDCVLELFFRLLSRCLTVEAGLCIRTIILLK